MLALGKSFSGKSWILLTFYKTEMCAGIFFQGEIWHLPVRALDCKQQKPTSLTGMKQILLKELGSECKVGPLAHPAHWGSTSLPRPSPAALTSQLQPLCAALPCPGHSRLCRCTSCSATDPTPQPLPSTISALAVWSRVFLLCLPGHRKTEYHGGDEGSASCWAWDCLQPERETR